MTFRVWISLVGVFFFFSGVGQANEFSDPDGMICRGDGSDARTFDIEKKASGDLIIRISGAHLLGGRVPSVRSVEAQFQLANCQPAFSKHWINGQLFTCVGPTQPVLRDGNGEHIGFPGNFERLYLSTFLVHGPLTIRAWYQYDLRITTDTGEIIDSGKFQVDPSGWNECKLRAD